MQPPGRAPIAERPLAANFPGMWSSIRRILIRAVESRGATAFIAASVVVGVLVGIGASLLVWSISGVTWLVDLVEKDMSLGTWAVIVTVPLGLLVSWAINRRFGPGIEGGGVDATMVGISLRGGYLPTRTVGAKIAATAVTLGSGGSAGREGPVVQIGATIGSSFARYTRFGEDQIRGLVAAGAGAGIGASFNAPIAGMLFAMEVIIGGFAIRHLNAVVVASVAAAVTTSELVGAERLLSSPSYTLGHPAELLLYAFLSLVAFAAGFVFLRTANSLAVIPEQWPGWIRPVGVGLAVAGLIVLEPELFGTGQDYLNVVLRLGPDSTIVWSTLVLIALLKILSSLLTWAGGGSGGTMMPSLVIGGSLGAAVALLLAPAWSLSTLSPGAFAVVGMAATFAATARAPLTAVLIVFEITGNYDLVLPLMLAAALATFLGDRFHPDSIYTQPLRRRGIHLTTTEDIDLLDTVTVGQVMTPPDAVLRPEMSIVEAAAELDRLHHHGLPVVADGKLCGIVTLADLAGPLLTSPATTVARGDDADPDHGVSHAAGFDGAGSHGGPRRWEAAGRFRRGAGHLCRHVPARERRAGVSPGTRSNHRPQVAPGAPQTAHTAGCGFLRDSDPAAVGSSWPESPRAHMARRGDPRVRASQHFGAHPAR